MWHSYQWTWWRHQMEIFSALLTLFEGGSTGHRWIPLTKAYTRAELWCFPWCMHEQTTEQTVEILVIWDAMALIMTSLQWSILMHMGKLIRYCGNIALCTKPQQNVNRQSNRLMTSLKRSLKCFIFILRSQIFKILINFPCSAFVFMWWGVLVTF